MKTLIMSKDGGFKPVSLNRRKAIRERCLNCVGWYSHEVNKCDFVGECTLHPFRTDKERQNAKDRSKAIRDYCKWCMNGKIAACSLPLCPLYRFRKSGVEGAENTGFFREKHDIESDFNPSKGKAAQNPLPTGLKRKKRACASEKQPD